MSKLKHQESIFIQASPEEVYDLVSDVTRTGEWSPNCKECWWHEGASAEVGAKFTGRNESKGHTWESISEVIAAEIGKEFTWIVGENYVKWSYTMKPKDGGTELTEHWEFLPAGLEMFDNWLGEKAPALVETRTQEAKAGIPATLAKLKQIAERQYPEN